MTATDDPRVTYHHNGDYWTWNINGTTGASDMIEDVQAALTPPACSHRGRPAGSPCMCAREADSPPLDNPPPSTTRNVPVGPRACARARAL